MGMPKRQMLFICRKEGYSVAELTDIKNELRGFHGAAAEPVFYSGYIFYPQPDDIDVLVK